MFYSGQFISISSFTASTCAAAVNTGTTLFYATGACGSINGTAPYTRYSVITRGSRSFALATNFMTSTCTGTGMLVGNVTMGTTCTNIGNGQWWIVAPATAVTAPANTQGNLIWTTAAACNAGITTTGLYAAMYQTAPTAAQQCTSNNNQAYSCPGAFTSTTGGFFVQRFFATAGCTGSPLQTNAMQLGVCTTQSVTTGTASSSFVAVPQPHGQTRFTATYFIGSATCARGTGVTVQNVNLGFNTTTCKRVTGAMSPMNVPTGSAFYSVSFATTMGFTSGIGQISYTTSAGCAAATLTTASSISVISTASVCQPMGMLTNSPVVAACPAVVATPSIIYASTR